MLSVANVFQHRSKMVSKIAPKWAPKVPKRLPRGLSFGVRFGVPKSFQNVSIFKFKSGVALNAQFCFVALEASCVTFGDHFGFMALDVGTIWKSENDETGPLGMLRENANWLPAHM